MNSMMIAVVPQWALATDGHSLNIVLVEMGLIVAAVVNDKNKAPEFSGKTTVPCTDTRLKHRVMPSMVHWDFLGIHNSVVQCRPSLNAVYTAGD